VEAGFGDVENEPADGEGVQLVAKLRDNPRREVPPEIPVRPQTFHLEPSWPGPQPVNRAIDYPIDQRFPVRPGEVGVDNQQRGDRLVYRPKHLRFQVGVCRPELPPQDALLHGSAQVAEQGGAFRAFGQVGFRLELRRAREGEPVEGWVFTSIALRTC